MYFSEEPRKTKDVSFVSDLIEQQQIWVSRALSSFLKQDILTFSEEEKKKWKQIWVLEQSEFFSLQIPVT